MNRNNMCFCKLFFMRFYTNIRTVCADKKYQKTLRMDAFLTAPEADVFRALWNSLGYPHSVRITNVQQSSHFSKNH